MAELSVLIPARHEQFLNRTVADVVSHAKGDTEVIVVLDGQWPDEPLIKYDNVRVVYLPESIGQRASTNLAAKISRATYVMKLDAHCSVDEGFDVKLIEAAQHLDTRVIQIPLQYHLHVFNWTCQACQREMYQGPTPTVCVNCQSSGPFERVYIWERRRNHPRSSTDQGSGGFINSWSWRFDNTLHFQYFNAYKSRVKADESFPETMSCLGACWFLGRERYWEIDGLDEAHGSWGQMGTELACKSWLSGGRLVVNKETWFAHLFRTQGGDFGFPYPLSATQTNHAREYSCQMWKHGQWKKAIHPLSWLIEKFAPVPGWSEDDLKAQKRLEQPTKGIVYYTDNECPEPIAKACRDRLKAIAPGPIVSVSLKPVDDAEKGIVLPMKRGYLAMFKQILAGLEALDTDIVYLCEHDVLYHPTHFMFTPPNRDCYFYNTNVWKVDYKTGRALHYDCSQTSGLCADRKLLVAHYRTRVAMVEANGFSRRMGFEPGTHHRAERVDEVKATTWVSEFPNLDIRHDHNLTPSRWTKAEFRDQRHTQGWIESDTIPGWGRMSAGLQFLQPEGVAC